MKKYLPYLLVVALVAAGIVGILALTGHTGGGKSKTDKAGAALTKAFNADKSNAANKIAITKVTTCKDVSGEQGAPANTYACTAQVGGVTPAASCGGFIFTTDAEQQKIVNLIYAQPIDPSNCT